MSSSPPGPTVPAQHCAFKGSWGGVLSGVTWHFLEAMLSRSWVKGVRVALRGNGGILVLCSAERVHAQRSQMYKLWLCDCQKSSNEVIPAKQREVKGRRHEGWSQATRQSRKWQLFIRKAGCLNVRRPKHCNDHYSFKRPEQSLSNHSVCESHFGFHGPLSVLQALTPLPTPLHAAQEPGGPPFPTKWVDSGLGIEDRGSWRTVTWHLPSKRISWRKK